MAYLFLSCAWGFIEGPVLLQEQLGVSELRRGVRAVEGVGHPVKVPEPSVERGLVPQRFVDPDPIHGWLLMRSSCHRSLFSPMT